MVVELIVSPAVPANDTSTLSGGPSVTFDSSARWDLTSSQVSTSFRNTSPTSLVIQDPTVVRRRATYLPVN